ncbi:MAG TPA: universal stress protein [Rhodocyclaceae bacterium]|nr:universal stress protein [Rhodocyclaceae bacterium]
MSKVLVPVDGSENALLAVRQVINSFIANSSIEVHLLHVRRPFSKHIAQFLGKSDRESFHREEAEKQLKSARDLLNQHNIPHAAHIELGEKAETINKVAQRLHVNQIVMGISRKNSLTRLLEDSVTNGVLEIAQVPVEVVAGSEVSKLEKYGVPAGVAAALAVLALVMTAD